MSYYGNKEFYIEVAKGNIPGHSLVVRSGKNSAVASGAWELVTNLSGAPNWLSAAATVRVKAGGDAADAAAGAGAQKVTVSGIDSNLDFISEDITLNANGTLASASTTALFWRTCGLHIPDGGVGTYGGSNTGAITLEDTAGTTDLLLMDAGSSQAQQCCYTVPDGYTAYLLGTESHTESLKPSDIRIRIRNNMNDTTTPFSPIRTVFVDQGVDGEAQNQPTGVLGVFSGNTDVWIEAYGSGAQTKVSAAMEFLLVQDGF